MKNFLAALCMLCMAFDVWGAPYRSTSRKKPAKRSSSSKETSKIHRYDYGLGLAIGAGTYSGFSGAMVWDKDAYIQAQLGVVILNQSIAYTTDYILEFPGFIGPNIVPYGGGGLTLLMGEDYATLISDADGSFHIGLRAPVGAHMMMTSFPIQLFGEIVPGFLLLAEAVPTLAINLGFRWFWR